MGLEVAFVVAAGYLLGSISFARIVPWLVGRRLEERPVAMAFPDSPDAGLTYSGCSASTVTAQLGRRYGLPVGVLDALKGALPVLLLGVLRPGSGHDLIVGLAVMAGHNWPAYHRFRGGRGQSVLLGMLLVLDPLAPLVCIPLGAAIGIFVFRDYGVAYNLGQWLLVPWFAAFGGWPRGLFALSANVLYSAAGWHETRDYLEARRAGRIRPITDWRAAFRHHPQSPAGGDRHGQ